MAQDRLLVFILLLVAIAILIQALAMVGILLSTLKISRKVDDIRADLREQLNPLAQSITAILTNAREPVRTISSNLAEISQILRKRTSQIDGLVAELVDKSRLQVIRVDQMVSDMVRKIETTTDAVQRGVLAPIQELSALMKGFKSALEFLFGRRRPSAVSEATQDEQMFI